MLGEHQEMDARLSRIEDAMRATFRAMPKNQHGKLHHTAVRYTLHSYFVQRHAWFVRGISELAETSNSTSPSGILQDRVDDFIQGAFERRLGSSGLNLRELAALAATYENLVHRESAERLDQTYRLMELDADDMDVAKTDEVLDTYMMGYIMALNYTKLAPKHLTKIRNKVNLIYPSWSQTQMFLREAREGSGFQRSFFNRRDVEDILSIVADQYGRWQNQECQKLKEQLLALEDTSIGVNGSGRVRISDFYGSALRDGNWQFSETMEYLQTLGALDLHDPNVPRVIIPNYVNSPSNCIASSKFYSVCCINECEDLMDHIEHHFAGPLAKPSEVAAFVASLPSSSVATGRALSPILLDRLDQIAEHHGGFVPIHGRLFAQWMHHAYPRECPYPHLAGAAQPKTTKEYYKHTGQMPTTSKDKMTEIVAEIGSASPDAALHASGECTAWSHDEEMRIGGGALRKVEEAAEGIVRFLRPLVYLCIAAAAVFSLVQRSMKTWQSSAKAITSTGNGKDLFV